MSAKKDFDYSVDLLGKHVSDHVKIIDPTFLKVPLLFRVDEVVPKTFIPRMPKSANETENSTVPRVVTATTLLGCMCGHTAMLWLITTRELGESGNNFYKISAFPFDFALLPDKSLVFDAHDTEEAWLITYDKTTVEYRSIDYGEMFFHKVSTVIQGNSKVNKVIADVLIKVDDSRGLPMAGNHVLEKGHYYLKMDLTYYAKESKEHGTKRMNFKDSEKIDITPVSSSVYKSFKDVSVCKKSK